MKGRKIDVSLIPPDVLRDLCRTFVEEAEKFDKNPENCKKFEDWKKKRAEQEKSCNIPCVTNTVTNLKTVTECNISLLQFQ